MCISIYLRCILYILNVFWAAVTLEYCNRLLLQYIIPSNLWPNCHENKNNVRVISVVFLFVLDSVCDDLYFFLSQV